MQINFRAEGLVSPSPLVGEGRGEGGRPSGQGFYW